MKTVKNIVAILAVILFTNTASAQTVNSVISQDPLSVKYIGTEEGYLLFRVEITNPNGSFSFLKINDKEVGEIYFQTVKNNAKVQTFKIEQVGAQEISFKLFSNNKFYRLTFIYWGLGKKFM